MLFNYGTDTFESEKERNLYYKFFAGYFFNDLVSGYERRVKSFYELLFYEYKDEENSFGDFKLHDDMEIPSSVYVTFDFHGYLLIDAKDRGELADVLIQDHQNNLFIAIEAKSLTDWNYEKDIIVNSDRIIQLKNHSENLYQVLLLTGDKLENCINKKNQNNSNWGRIIKNEKDLKLPLRVITWENLFDISLEQDDDSCKEAIEFFQEHIKKKREDFRNFPQL